MFYPVNSLRKGGRFYLCWLADSWPNRFAATAERQLLSYDVVIICDELIEQIQNESGKPSNRFSLRLSSQLMRGLVRVYLRKVDMLLNNLCMINSVVMRNSNKRSNAQADVDLPRRRRGRDAAVFVGRPLDTIQDELPHGNRLDELLQNSQNAVANVEEITLKDAVIPEILLPPNDNFGEEHPDDALRVIGDVTLEAMLAPTAAQHSALDWSHDPSRDRSRDQSRLAPDVNMERISEHDVTLFRKSDGEALLPVPEDKDISGIPDIPIPELPVPQENPQPMEVSPAAPTPAPPAQPELEPDPMELEELDEAVAELPRRRRRRPIIDRVTKLPSAWFRARLASPRVELRSQSINCDVILMSRTPAEALLKRPASRCFGRPLIRMFLRNLGQPHRPERTQLETMPRRVTTVAAGVWARIETEDIDEPQPRHTGPAGDNAQQDNAQQDNAQQDNAQQDNAQQDNAQQDNAQQDNAQQDNAQQDNAQQDNAQQDNAQQDNAQQDNAPQSVVSQDNLPFQEVTSHLNISDQLTQKILTLRKRASGVAVHTPSKLRRLHDESLADMGMRQQTDAQDATLIQAATCEDLSHLQPDKENIERSLQHVDERHLSAMLQAAGLADKPVTDMADTDRAFADKSADRPVTDRRTASPALGRGAADTDTPLGSLDRTRVSLGESDDTTESIRLIRWQWGTAGTMHRIARGVRRGVRPLGVRALLSAPPPPPPHAALAAARCFYSILKLVNHGFVRVIKDPETNSIHDIVLGRRFDNIRFQ